MSVKITSFYWVRHAPVKSMIPGKITGQRDVSVNLKDTRAIKNCAQHLEGLDEAIWITSTLTRTQKTAYALAKELGFTIKPVAYKELMEQNFGLWQSKTWDELSEDEAARTFWEDPAHICPPSGESFEQLFVRLKKMINHLIKNHSGETLVIVAHAGTIRAALAYALNLDLSKALSFKVDTLSVSHMTHIDESGQNPNWSLNYVNRV